MRNKNIVSRYDVIRAQRSGEAREWSVQWDKRKSLENASCCRGIFNEPHVTVLNMDPDTLKGGSRKVYARTYPKNQGERK